MQRSPSFPTAFLAGTELLEWTAALRKTTQAPPARATLKREKINTEPSAHVPRPPRHGTGGSSTTSRDRALLLHFLRVTAGWQRVTLPVMGAESCVKFVVSDQLQRFDCRNGAVVWARTVAPSKELGGSFLFSFVCSFTFPWTEKCCCSLCLLFVVCQRV